MRLHLPLSTMLLLWAGSLVAQYEAYTVRPLEIRPVGTDFAPMIMDSGLVFCSLRERDQLVGYTSKETGDPLCDLYRVSIRNGIAGKPAPFNDIINTEVNDGPAAFTNGNRTMCISRNLKSAKDMDGEPGDENLGLFFSERKGDGWSRTKAFDYNNPAYNVMHATFSADGQRLYFASDMPGGMGGSDLYVCELEDGDWSVPLNLGKEVNTSANELSPFIDEDGALYFASNREGGLGGLDVWVSRANGNKWNTPKNLPAPINSERNDLGITVQPGGLSGYFSSARNGDDAIFHFERVVPLFSNCVEQQENNYCYSFSEKGSVTIADLPLRYEWNMGDGTRVPGLNAKHCYAGPGRYKASLNIVDTVSGDVFFEQGHYNLTIDDIEQAFITVSDSARTGREVQFNARQTHLPYMRMVEWKWDFGDGTFGDGRDVDHAYAAAGEYLVRLDILGKPDADGAMPNRCVTRRVVVIDRFKDRLDAPVEVQYTSADGEEREFIYQALGSDDFLLAVQDGDDVRFSVELFRSRERLDLNDPRFTEIKKSYPIIERYDPVSSTYTYSVGEAKNLAELYDVYAKVKELKFMDAMVMAIEVEKVLDMSQLSLLDAAQLNNSMLRVNNVLFNTGEHHFEPAFEAQLKDVLMLIQKHTQLNLVIEAHTDDVGTNANNLALSQRRAQTVTDWFLAHGVGSDRLVAVGHGENKPLVANKDAERRSMNRRVEFRLALESGDQASK